MFFYGGFGRVELGREDGAEDVMSESAARTPRPVPAASTATRHNLTQFETPDTGDDAKVTYFTPRIVGFQLGASFVPDNGDRD